ncbi:hypothetical protein N8Z26_05555 [Burkholderiales bacterium]|nr:hypothetical protein [Burkholderiales bacterium]
MKFVLPLIAIIFLSACDDYLATNNMHQGEFTAPPNSFIKEANMPLIVENECAEESALTASK